MPQSHVRQAQKLLLPATASSFIKEILKENKGGKRVNWSIPTIAGRDAARTMHGKLDPALAAPHEWLGSVRPR